MAKNPSINKGNRTHTFNAHPSSTSLAHEYLTRSSPKTSSGKINRHKALKACQLTRSSQMGHIQRRITPDIAFESGPLDLRNTELVLSYISTITRQRIIHLEVESSVYLHCSKQVCSHLQGSCGLNRAIQLLSRAIRGSRTYISSLKMAPEGSQRRVSLVVIDPPASCFNVLRIFLSRESDDLTSTY